MSGARAVHLDPERSARAIRIVHLGPDVRYPGGMASVISELTDLSTSEFTMSAMATWRPNARFLSMALALAAAGRIIGLRLIGRRLIIHTHLSEGLSFL